MIITPIYVCESVDNSAEIFPLTPAVRKFRTPLFGEAKIPSTRTAVAGLPYANNEFLCFQPG